MKHGPIDYAVPVSRLAWDTGDIFAAYSGDRIGDAGKIRAPFYFRGEAYVTTATSNHEAEAYRLVPVEQFQGDATTYRLKVTHNTEDVDAGDHARNDPNGFYHGITVKHGSKTYVLCGPSKLFGPESATVDEAQAPQRDTEQLSMF